ncbi:hypothetical protein D0463_04780 [Bacillus sp. V59.32b]|nr:hypothetical protein D0463_04780 [Bacillus sp. V59.32b]
MLKKVSHEKFVFYGMMSGYILESEFINQFWRGSMKYKTCPNCKGDGFEDIDVAFGGILTCPICGGDGKIK